MTAPAAVAHRSTVLAAVESARGRSSHVIALHADPSSALEDTLETANHERVAVRPCPSALAGWDALSAWEQERGARWLVLLTDATEDQLGPGLMARVAHRRILRPDSWDSVQIRFRATRIEPALRARTRGTTTADALLRIEPQPSEGGWPVARAGVLTRDHVYGSVSTIFLGLPPEPGGDDILIWTLDPRAAERLADLRRDGGDDLTDSVLDWLCARAGSPLLKHILASGGLSAAIPLGIAFQHVLRAPTEEDREALGAAYRLEGKHLPDAYRNTLLPGATGPRSDEVKAYAALADHAVRRLLPDRPSTALKALHRAERILRNEGADSLVAGSAILPGGLSARQIRLADALGGPGGRLEALWADVAGHPLSGIEPEGGAGAHSARSTLQVLHAAVRLDRWLAGSAPGGTGQDERTDVEAAAGLAREHVQDGAWAENALNTLAKGVPAELGISADIDALHDRVLARRAELDRAFADRIVPITDGRPLPQDGSGAVVYLEDVLASIAVPLARAPRPDRADGAAVLTGAIEGGSGRNAPRGALLLLLDGMSASAAVGIMRSLVAADDAWREIGPETSPYRGTALALLPTLTTHSRTSFFTGEPVTGAAAQESAGIEALARRTGLPGAAVFHKDDLDSVSAGAELAGPIAQAIADTRGLPLVACVLNTIDDALAKGEPADDWNADRIRHFKALLAAAANAGRTVILTADHGHVVERRGRYESALESDSARSRSAEAGPAGPGEVLVHGRRVLTGSAVLAVDELLRYKRRAEGYHGGASLAEIAVPLIVLQPRPAGFDDDAWDAELPDGWVFVPSAEPLWWSQRQGDAQGAAGGAMGVSQAPTGRGLPGRKSPKAQPQGPDLFESYEEPEPARDGAGRSTGAAVVGSERYQEQKGLAPRALPEATAVAALIDALLAAGGRLPDSALTRVLAVAPVRLPRVLAVIEQVLNVDGYPILHHEDGFLTIDRKLLADQFEVAI